MRSRTPKFCHPPLLKLTLSFSIKQESDLNQPLLRKAGILNSAMVDIDSPVPTLFNTRRKYSKGLKHNKQPMLGSSDSEVDTKLYAPGFNEILLDIRGHEPTNLSSPNNLQLSFRPSARRDFLYLWSVKH